MDIKVEVHDEDWHLNPPMDSMLSLFTNTVIEVQHIKREIEDNTENEHPNISQIEQLQIQTEESSCQSKGNPPTKRKKRKNKNVIIYWNMERIFKELGTHKQCITFSENNGFLPTQKICSRHHTNMILTNGATFRCYKGCPAINRTQGTLFANLNLSMPILYRLMYCFAINMPVRLTRRECPLPSQNGTISTSSINYWYKIFREAIVSSHRNEKQVGSKGSVVEVTEIQIQTDNWVVCILASDSDDLRLEDCSNKKRTKNILVPIIKKHVKKGSFIQTDSNNIYNSLCEQDYVLEKTKPLRLLLKCQTLKNNYNGYDVTSVDNVKEWLIEYIWRRYIRKNELDEFKELLSCLQHRYRVE